MIMLMNADTGLLGSKKAKKSLDLTKPHISAHFFIGRGAPLYARARRAFLELPILRCCSPMQSGSANRTTDQLT